MAKEDFARSMVLSVEAKPRLRWTEQLHDQFAQAVSQLGGAEKATPKSVLRVMGVPGLTLFHLKSHLQKYRLAISRDDTDSLANSADFHEEDTVSLEETRISQYDEDNKRHINRDVLQMQVEVQRKLQEQIEVQKHLQLRIEAQGKYLHSVLKRAQEILSAPSSSETTKTELSELVSAVETECGTTSPFHFKQSLKADCSTDSCLTSSEKQATKNEEAETRTRAIKRKRESGIRESSLCENDGEKRMFCLARTEEIDLNR